MPPDLRPHKAPDTSGLRRFAAAWFLVKNSRSLEFRPCFSARRHIYRPTETWPSGRRRSPAKGVYGKPYRGFESLRLRHLPFLLSCVRCCLAPYGAVFVDLSAFVVAIGFSSTRLVSIHCVVEIVVFYGCSERKADEESGANTRPRSSWRRERVVPCSRSIGSAQVDCARHRERPA